MNTSMMLLLPWIWFGKMVPAIYANCALALSAAQAMLGIHVRLMLEVAIRDAALMSLRMVLTVLALVVVGMKAFLTNSTTFAFKGCIEPPLHA